MRSLFVFLNERESKTRNLSTAQPGWSLMRGAKSTEREGGFSKRKEENNSLQKKHFHKGYKQLAQVNNLLNIIHFI